MSGRAESPEVLIAATGIAAYVPARSAAAVNPLEVLRTAERTLLPFGLHAFVVIRTGVPLMRAARAIARVSQWRAIALHVLELKQIPALSSVKNSTLFAQWPQHTAVIGDT